MREMAQRAKSTKQDLHDARSYLYAEGREFTDSPTSIFPVFQQSNCWKILQHCQPSFIEHIPMRDERISGCRGPILRLFLEMQVKNPLQLSDRPRHVITTVWAGNDDF